jgi:hypothetical protein
MEYATDGAAQSAYVTSATAAYTADYPPAHSTTYVKSTTDEGSGNHTPFKATDPALSLVDGSTGNTWYSVTSTVTNQRFHIDIGASAIINRIYYENVHSTGIVTDRGVNNFTFWGSNNAAAFAELTYATDTNWTQITGLSQSTMDEHIGANQADPKYITIAGNSSSYRYYALKIADNHGNATFVGLRHIELQTGAWDLQSYSESTIKTQGSYALKLSATTDALNETVTRELLPAGVLNTGDLFMEFESDTIADTNGTHTPVNTNTVKDNTLYSDYNSSTESRRFDGNDYITIPAHADFVFGTGDLTIDFWYARAGAGDHANETIYSNRSGDTTEAMFQVVYNTGGNINIQTYNDSAVNKTLSASMDLSSDTAIHHYAFVRSSGTWYIFIDGIAQAKVDDEIGSLSVGEASENVSFGRRTFTDTRYLNGQLDNFRVTKGTALWTSNFNLNDRTLHYETGDTQILDLTGKDTIKLDARSTGTGSNLSLSIHDAGGTTTTHTINIASADTYQTDSWDISGVADADKDAIDQIQLKVLNAGSARDFFIDNIYAE